jgi:hypothetical protein
MSRFGFCLAIVGMTSVVSGPARADIYFDAPKDADVNQFRNQYEAKLKEESAAPTAELLKQSEVLAHYLVYRLTKKQEFHSQPGGMAKLYRECDTWITRAVPPECINTQLGQVLLKKMLESLAQVLAPPDQLPITRVNGARVLARLATVSGIPESADVLVKLITDPYKGDGARYWAFRGLRGLYEKNPKAPTGERREKTVEALVQFIEQPSKVGTNAPLEELDGIRVVRREAVRALGATRDPGVGNKKGAEAAWVLVRILRGDKNVTPEPRLDEQVEAAVALGNLRADPKRDDYQAGYAVANVGHFLMDFFARYNARKDNREHPWKIYAARMEEAMQEMAAAHPNDATVKEVAPLTVTLLRGIRENKTTTSDNDLRGALEKMTAPKSIYKSNDKAVVTPREGP